MRDRLCAVLEASKLQMRRFFHPMRLQPKLRSDPPQHLPVAESLHGRGLCPAGAAADRPKAQSSDTPADARLRVDIDEATRRLVSARRWSCICGCREEIAALLPQVGFHKITSYDYARFPMPVTERSWRVWLHVARG